MRAERFELITKLILSQPPLPIGLHALKNFGFRNANFELEPPTICNPKFAIRNLIWYRRRDSNPHCLVSKTSASSPLGYAGIGNLEFGIAESELAGDGSGQFAIRILQFAIDWWTWHDLNVRPRPSQSRALDPLSYRSEHFRLPIVDCSLNQNSPASTSINRQLAIGNRQ